MGRMPLALAWGSVRDPSRSDSSCPSPSSFSQTSLLSGRRECLPHDLIPPRRSSPVKELPPRQRLLVNYLQREFSAQLFGIAKARKKERTKLEVRRSHFSAFGLSPFRVFAILVWYYDATLGD